MDQSNVPNDLIEAAEAAVGDSEWIEADPGIRAVLAAVLPLYEQRIREQIAKEVRYGGPTRVSPLDHQEYEI